ncbi:MAG: hypothetical protein JWP36_737 [Paucimonas sp.]|nr:hypothetical protein [Paucimonas sp.]
MPFPSLFVASLFCSRLRSPLGSRLRRQGPALAASIAWAALPAGLLLAGVLLLGLLLPAQPLRAQEAAAQWPRIVLPDGVRSFDMGEQVNLNGMPMRLQGFVSALGPDSVRDGFRRVLGHPLIENTIGQRLVLGRAQDQYYILVQIEAAGSGSRGVLAVSHLQAALDQSNEAAASAMHWLSRLPAGSRMLSNMQSRDGDRLSRHLVIVNTHDESLNAHSLKSLMAGDGYVLERDSSGASAAQENAAALPSQAAGARVLYFKAANREGVATIHREAQGRTAIVLNLVTRMERFK